MRNSAHQTRENRTITVDCQKRSDLRSAAWRPQGLCGIGAGVHPLAWGFQLQHKATCRSGRVLTRHSHDVRVRLAVVTIWRLQCTMCKAVFAVVFPHFVLRDRQMHPDVACNALVATHGGLSLEFCAIIDHLAPMAVYRLTVVRQEVA